MLEHSGGRRLEVLVVDNASSDESAAIAEGLADEHDAVRLLRSATNRGYAGAVNLALAEAEGDHIAVLNMDVVVGAGWLDPLVALLEANPAAGVACPLIVLDSDPGGSWPLGRTSTRPGSASTAGWGSRGASPGTRRSR